MYRIPRPARAARSSARRAVPRERGARLAGAGGGPPAALPLGAERLARALPPERDVDPRRRAPAVRVAAKLVALLLSDAPAQRAHPRAAALCHRAPAALSGACKGSGARLVHLARQRDGALLTPLLEPVSQRRAPLRRVRRRRRATQPRVSQAVRSADAARAPARPR